MLTCSYLRSQTLPLCAALCRHLCRVLSSTCVYCTCFRALVGRLSHRCDIFSALVNDTSKLYKLYVQTMERCLCCRVGVEACPEKEKQHALKTDLVTRRKHVVPNASSSPSSSKSNRAACSDVYSDRSSRKSWSSVRFLDLSSHPSCNVCNQNDNYHSHLMPERDQLQALFTILLHPRSPKPSVPVNLSTLSLSRSTFL